MTTFAIVATIWFGLGAICSFIKAGSEDSGSQLFAGVVAAAFTVWGIITLCH